MAARVLDFCESFLKAGTDAALIGKIEDVKKALRDAEIAELVPRKESKRKAA